MSVGPWYGMGMGAQGEIGRSEHLDSPMDSGLSAVAWTKTRGARARKVSSDNTVATECLGCETCPSRPLRKLSFRVHYY